MKNIKAKKIDKKTRDNYMGRIYFPNSYYNSLDFIYKYITEVIIKEVAEVPKSFFKKYFTGLEDHRFSMKKSVETNSLYNNIYPMVGILVNQDFSGAGPRTQMSSAKFFNIMSSEETMPTIFHENNISIQISSNIYKYNATINAKFDSSFSASNFVSRIYNNIHINKHYYPSYSDLRYRIDKRIYMAIRELYRSEYENDESFLRFINRNATFRIIREFDKATGNIDYFLLLPIRPLILIQTPSQSDSNNNGLRESIVSINIDIEIELPGSLYFSAPMPLLRKMNFHFYDSVIFDDKDDPIIKNEQKEIEKDKKLLNYISDEETISVVTMPKIDVERIKNIHKKELRYETTLSISERSDLLIIEDPSILTMFKNSPETFIKIFDADGLDIVAKNIKFYDDCIELTIDGYIEDTIVLIQIYN